MGVATQFAAGLFAVFFVLSSFGKLDAWETWAKASAAWSPSWIPRLLVLVALPLIELSIAMALVLHPQFGLVLCAIFLATLAIGVALLSPTQQGKECGCFGRLMRSRIGPRLALRNVLLAALAATVSALAFQLEVRGLGLPQILTLSLVGALAALLLETKQANVFGPRTREVSADE
jgi:hypothetical protein